MCLSLSSATEGLVYLSVGDIDRHLFDFLALHLTKCPSLCDKAIFINEAPRSPMQPMRLDGPDRSRFRIENQAFPRTRLASANQQGDQGGLRGTG